MYGAFPRPDYYDHSALHAPHQPQLVQCSHRDMKFPRSQSALLRLDLDSHYPPCQGGEAYSGYPLFASPSFRSSRPRQKCLAYTPLARGISASICCFSLHRMAMWSYLLPTSHIAVLRCSLILRLQTWIHPRISSRISHIQP